MNKSFLTKGFLFYSTQAALGKKFKTHKKIFKSDNKVNLNCVGPIPLLLK